jgi:hypothetical protein
VRVRAGGGVATDLAIGRIVPEPLRKGKKPVSPREPAGIRALVPQRDRKRTGGTMESITGSCRCERVCLHLR